MRPKNPPYTLLPAVSTNTGRMDRSITREEIPGICSGLRQVRTRGDLLEALYRVVSRYSLQDLLYLRVILERELAHLPPSYRRRLFPKIIEQIFGAHHCLIALYREGGARNLTRPLESRYYEFVDLVERACTAEKTYLAPRFELLYFLLAGFNIFVLDMPGHPVGTPFPGGLEVERSAEGYLCPVRDKEDEVENALCPFCPARQK